MKRDGFVGEDDWSDPRRWRLHPSCWPTVEETLEVLTPSIVSTLRAAVYGIAPARPLGEVYRPPIHNNPTACEVPGCGRPRWHRSDRCKDHKSYKDVPPAPPAMRGRRRPEGIPGTVCAARNCFAPVWGTSRHCRAHGGAAESPAAPSDSWFYSSPFDPVFSTEPVPDGPVVLTAEVCRRLIGVPLRKLFVRERGGLWWVEAEDARTRAPLGWLTLAIGNRYGDANPIRANLRGAVRIRPVLAYVHFGDGARRPYWALRKVRVLFTGGDNGNRTTAAV